MRPSTLSLLFTVYVTVMEQGGHQTRGTAPSPGSLTEPAKAQAGDRVLGLEDTRPKTRQSQTTSEAPPNQATVQAKPWPIPAGPLTLPLHCLCRNLPPGLEHL